VRKSALSWVHADGRAYEQRAVVLTSMSGDGYTVEAGITKSLEVDDLIFTGNLIGIYLDPGRPTVIEAKGPHGFQKVVQPYNTLMINPAGVPITQRNGFCRWGVVELSTEKMRKLIGRDVDFPPTREIDDQALAAVIRGLIHDAENGAPAGPLFAESLLIAAAAKLASFGGTDAAVLTPSGALAQKRLRRIIEKIEDTIAEQMRVEDLAAEAGLSPAHFSREFKRHTNETPHAFIMRVRLERAQEMLALGRSIAAVAAECGFYDQGHLTRAFKQKYGVTPSEYVRSVREAKASL
jgi:AraC-like DNA-binding protein